jgi:hypothetical protein
VTHTPPLGATVERLRKRIGHIRQKRDAITEQDTKVAFINPLLTALGWNLEDLDEVRSEYRHKSQDNPVDYALLMLRSPCLFVEAKSLNADLSDRKWISQTLGYATVVGVEWCVLTNGDEYRLYNAHAPVDAEEKLFRTVRLSEAPLHDTVVETLELLSKEKMGENRLNLLWKAHFVDRQVRTNLEELVGSQDPSLVRLLHKKLSELTPNDIRNSLKRADLRIEFPGMSLPPTPLLKREEASRVVHGKKPEANQRAQGQKPRATHAVIPGKVSDLIAAGLIQPPLELETIYKKTRLTAMVQLDGTVLFNGQPYHSVSTVAGMARNAVSGPPQDGRTYYQTNGWTFWKYRDPTTGDLTEIDHLRQRLKAKTSQTKETER